MLYLSVSLPAQRVPRVWVSHTQLRREATLWLVLPFVATQGRRALVSMQTPLPAGLGSRLRGTVSLPCIPRLCP